jgi:hypothetical protein
MSRREGRSQHEEARTHGQHCGAGDEATGRLQRPVSRANGDTRESRGGLGEEIPDMWDHTEMRWLMGGTEAFTVVGKWATHVGFAGPDR